MDRLLKTIGANAGPGAAKSARSVLSGMFRLAARYGAVTVNPVREAAPVTPAKKTRWPGAGAGWGGGGAPATTG